MKNAIILVLLLVVGGLGFLLGRGGTPLSKDSVQQTESAPAEREILYWVAPMDPNYRRDQPGKSPMGMDLVPVYADEAGAGDGVRISPAVVNNLGVRTTAVQKRPLWRRVEATAYVGFDETRISNVNLRTQGWIQRLLVNAEGERVKQGDLLFELYSPELVNAQKEYLQAHRRGDARLKQGAAEKLRALGMIPEEIEALEKRGEAEETIRVFAPRDGIVTALNVREGVFVQPNSTVVSLADLSSVWLQAEVFESQAEWVAAGQAAEARFDYLPGSVFTGQVDYIYPVLDPVTRTLRVRLRFDNPHEALKPNMYAQVSIYGRLRPQALAIPREALIRAPGHDRVVVSSGAGQFHVHEVLTGMESGDWVEIVSGVEEGDEVVTSAQFLIDSEASVAGSVHRLDQTGVVHAATDPVRVIVNGRVVAVDAAARKLRVSHGPIEELGWPPMTMDFDVDSGVSLAAVKASENIQFVLRQGEAGEFLIEQIRSPEETVNRRPGETLEESGQPREQPAEATRQTQPGEYMGRGTVREVSVSEHRLKLTHEPIEALGWPKMTMNFSLLEDVDISALQPGQRIHFSLRKQGKRYLISAIHIMDSQEEPEGERHD